MPERRKPPPPDDDSDNDEGHVASGHGKDHRCGVGPCHPGCMQGCANIKAYVAMMSLILVLVFVYYSCYIGVIRTIEKRFGLPSYKTGLVMSISDTVQIVFVIVIGYLGRKTHKPRFLGISALLSAVGVLLAAAPYFVYGPYKYDPTSVAKAQMLKDPSANREMLAATNLSPLTNGNLSGVPNASPWPQDGNFQVCSDQQEVNRSRNQCNEEGEDSLTREGAVALSFFYASSVVLGIGTSSIFTLGISFIDENVPKVDSAIYIGIVTSMFAWGPIIGFSLAAFITRLPEDLGEFVVSPYDPAFIGCWWLGHVIVASLLVVVSVPMLLLPKHFPDYYVHCKTDSKPVAGNVKTTAWKELKAFPRAVWDLLTNLPFMLLSFSKVFAMMYIIGIIVNQSRFIEIHYEKPAFISNMATAVCGAFTAAAGSILGGILMKRWKLTEKGTSLLYVFATSCTVLGLVVSMLFHCPQQPQVYEGVSQLTPNGYNLSMTCNMACNCSRDQYQPVCSPEGVQHFSPCHAGCLAGNETHFASCACAPAGVSESWCGQSCSYFVPYIVVFAVSSFLGSLAGVPVTILTFRLVAPEMKAFALGIVSAMYNTLIFVPGPILFGSLFDSACQIWKTSCGERLSCLAYDTARYRHYMFGVTLSFEVVALLLAIGLYFYIRLRFKESDVTTDVYGEEKTKLRDEKTDPVVNKIYVNNNA